MDVKKLVSQMTLEEKASLCSGEGFWHTKAVERLGVPAVMVSDGPHGLRKQDLSADHLGVNESIKAVCFPAGCATAASFDRELLRTLGEAIGETCQSEKVSVILGPAVNIKRSPLCGRNFEYYSEDPLVATETATAFIQGVQSKNIGVSMKHFAANNQEHRRMSSSTNVDERAYREIYLAAFEGAVKNARPWTIMCSYNRINGVFACENHELLTDILRGEWGFDGYVMSDWGATARRVECLKAGMDLEMPATSTQNDRIIVDAVKHGELDEAVLDTACERILGINYRYLENAKPETPWNKEAQHALAGEIAAECMVLLKNDDALLPLKKSQKVAFIGEFAEKPRFQGGGSSHINCFKVTSALNAAKGVVDFTYSKGFDIATDSTTDELINQAVEAAKAAEVAVVFAGLPDSYESEGYDRAHMRMPECQNALISKVAAANPNTVVVLHNGSPVEMPWVSEVKAVLEAYIAGQAVGSAEIALLFGDKNPCAKLAESFPVKLEDNPSYLFYQGEGNEVDYREGVFVGYRYYESKKMPVLFPFGHGLSYTSFEYSGLSLSADRIEDTQTVTAKVTVKNTGTRFGKEVVQLYVAPPKNDVLRPVRELRAYAKVALEPGESKTVCFELGKRAFAYWNTTLHNWFVDSGEYTVQICKNAHEVVLEAPVTVNSSVKLPVKYDLNTILLDIMSDPEAAARLEPFKASIINAIAPPSNASDTAQEAISNEMMFAMVKYMPLRSVISFAGESITFEQLYDLVYSLNK